MLKQKTYIVFYLIFFISTLLGLAASARADNEYTIGPGDVLEILVWNDEQLSRQVVVPPDGVISYPLVGDFIARGISINVLEQHMQKKFEQYLPDTPVSVSLVAANDLKIYVMGKVNKPGVFPINLETSVMQALAMAGGLSTFADAKDILLLRRKGDRIKKLDFNYKDIEKGKRLDQNILLKRGDVIVVP